MRTKQLKVINSKQFDSLDIQTMVMARQAASDQMGNYRRTVQHLEHRLAVPGGLLPQEAEALERQIATARAGIATNQRRFDDLTAALADMGYEVEAGVRF